MGTTPKSLCRGVPEGSGAPKLGFKSMGFFRSPDWEAPGRRFAPQGANFVDHFRAFLGSGSPSAKRAPAAAGALFSRVPGVSLGTFLATFPIPFLRWPLRGHWLCFRASFKARVGPHGDRFCCIWGAQGAYKGHQTRLGSPSCAQNFQDLF